MMLIIIVGHKAWLAPVYNIQILIVSLISDLQVSIAIAGCDLAFEAAYSMLLKSKRPKGRKHEWNESS